MRPPRDVDPLNRCVLGPPVTPFNQSRNIFIVSFADDLNAAVTAIANTPRDIEVVSHPLGGVPKIDALHPPSDDYFRPSQH
jgi:hypothetical protein